VIAYALAYAAGATVSYRQLSVQLGGLSGSRLLRFAVRISLVVGVSALLALASRHWVHGALEGRDTLTALVRLVLVGLVGMVSYLVLARLVRLDEVSEVTRMLAGRLGGRGRSGGPRSGGKRRAGRGGKRRAGR
jgi:putative peptidoglycan lipid II flippase